MDWLLLYWKSNDIAVHGCYRFNNTRRQQWFSFKMFWLLWKWYGNEKRGQSKPICRCTSYTEQAPINSMHFIRLYCRASMLMNVYMRAGFMNMILCLKPWDAWCTPRLSNLYLCKSISKIHWIKEDVGLRWCVYGFILLFSEIQSCVWSLVEKLDEVQIPWVCALGQDLNKSSSRRCPEPPMWRAK